MGATIWILSLVVLAFSWWILAGGRAELPRALTSVRFCLLVTAHPDDECMFFAPTLLSLKRAGVRVSLLCLSEGNCDGLGGIRKEELKQSALLLGIPTDRVSVLNVPYVLDTILFTVSLEFKTKQRPSRWPEILGSISSSKGCLGAIERVACRYGNHRAPLLNWLP